jgi:leucyl aminopeptidase
LPIAEILVAADARALPLDVVLESEFAGWRDSQDPATRTMLVAQRFDGRRYGQGLIFNGNGTLERAVIGIRSCEDLWSLGLAAQSLPVASFVLAATLAPAVRRRFALGFVLGAYQFTRYRPKAQRPLARLVIEDADERAELSRLAAAVFHARDLVNTPTEDMGPEHLAEVVAELGTAHGAHVHSTVGSDLLRDNYPAIHAVGRASHRAPRLLELNWGSDGDPRIAILGKGVCFDTGGLDIKSSDGMGMMKKDMGGAAVAIALARLIMEARLPVRLQLLIPAVENAIGPESYRPGEVINTRAGLTIEIGNTDAEGRVVLCDALARAAEGKPELIMDFATLTGAARIALGADLPALFCNRPEIAQALLAAGRENGDPLWEMPLWDDYYALIESKIADLNNAGVSRMGGCITAALYLKRFVPADIPWVHLDTYCWSEGRPGRPPGGDCQGLRAAFAYLQGRFGG